MNKPSINILQVEIELTDDEIKDYQKKVLERLKLDYSKKNWNFIFSHEELYDQLEQKVRENILDNPFELLIVGQTITPSKFFEEMDKIKDKIPKQNLVEDFLYHGALLKNHQRIVDENFYLPTDEKYVQKNDDGYCGKGIYATENIFYAAMYANNNKSLNPYERTFILCCKAVYNDSKIKNLCDLSHKGKPFEDDYKENYGINHALVGSSKKFVPIKEEEIEENVVCAHENVFPNTCQFVPCCSFTIMRMDHYILYKDKEKDKDENQKQLKDLKKIIEANIYCEDSVDKALDVIMKKKFTKVKLVTDGSAESKELIEKAIELIGSNFICLVFAKENDNLDWVSQMTNVLFTYDIGHLKEFCNLRMNKDIVISYVEKINSEYKSSPYKCQINEKELLSFPGTYITKAKKKNIISTNSNIANANANYNYNNNYHYDYNDTMVVIIIVMILMMIIFYKFGN